MSDDGSIIIRKVAKTVSYFLGAVAAVVVSMTTISPFWPDQWTIASKHWTKSFFEEEYAPSINKVDEMYKIEVLKQITYYKRRECKDKADSTDTLRLSEWYGMHRKEFGHDHKYLSMTLEQACEDAGVSLPR